MNLFGEINPETSKWTTGGRSTELVLMKEEKGPYWDRLLKESTKYHWLKVDFNRWKDEDDSEDEAPMSDNFEEVIEICNNENIDNNFLLIQMMRKMGGMSNFGGAGADGMPSFNENDDLDADDDIPSLEDDEKKE